MHTVVYTNWSPHWLCNICSSIVLSVWWCGSPHWLCNICSSLISMVMSIFPSVEEEHISSQMLDTCWYWEGKKRSWWPLVVICTNWTLLPVQQSLDFNTSRNKRGKKIIFVILRNNLISIWHLWTTTTTNYSEKQRKNFFYTLSYHGRSWSRCLWIKCWWSSLWNIYRILFPVTVDLSELFPLFCLRLKQELNRRSIEVGLEMINKISVLFLFVFVLFLFSFSLIL